MCNVFRNLSPILSYEKHYKVAIFNYIESYWTLLFSVTPEGSMRTTWTLRDALNTKQADAADDGFSSARHIYWVFPSFTGNPQHTTVIEPRITAMSCGSC